MSDIENLKVSVEPQSEILRKVSFEIPRAEYARRFDSALNKATGKVQLKGFRPGRVPRAMVAKMYGEAIHGEVMEELAVSALDSTVRDHNLKVIGRPEVNFDAVDEGKDVTFTASVTVLPEPEIKDFRGASLDVEVGTLNEEALEKDVENLRISRATFEPLTGRDKAENGDFVKIDYNATVDGESFQGSHRHDVTVEIGSKRLADGIEDALIGTTVGESVQVSVPFPEDHRDPNLAGKTALYSVTLKSIETRVLPPLDDEFARLVNMGETVEELRAKLREQATTRVTEGDEQRKERALYEHILEKNPFEVPQILVDEEIRGMLFNMGALNRRDERAYQMDLSSFRGPLGKEAEFRVRSLIALDRILDQETMTITDDDLETWLDGLVAESGAKSRDELNRNFGYPESKDRLRQVLAREKKSKELIESASFTEKPLQEKSEDEEM